jgi:hypothetical protein
MNESRQQRRARERAEAKAARRAQPPQDPAAAAVAPARRPHVLEVQLSRFSFPDDEEEPVTWSAQWGLRDDAVGTEDGNEDVQQLIYDIIEDARRWTDRYELSIEWELSGDAPHGKTVEDVLSELGVTLPETVPPEPDPA